MFTTTMPEPSTEKLCQVIKEVSSARKSTRGVLDLRNKRILDFCRIGKMMILPNKRYVYAYGICRSVQGTSTLYSGSWVQKTDVKISHHHFDSKHGGNPYKSLIECLELRKELMEKGIVVCRSFKIKEDINITKVNNKYCVYIRNIDTVSMNSCGVHTELFDSREEAFDAYVKSLEKIKQVIFDRITSDIELLKKGPNNLPLYDENLMPPKRVVVSFQKGEAA